MWASLELGGMASVDGCASLECALIWSPEEADPPEEEEDDEEAEAEEW